MLLRSRVVCFAGSAFKAIVISRWRNCCLNLCSHFSFRLSQHEKFFVVYLGNEMLLSGYLNITDSFFSWGSQRKRLIYVNAIFVSAVAPMLYTLNLLTRFIPTELIAVTQPPLSMNPWIPFFRTVMTIFVFYTNDHSVVCDHARFVFGGIFKKMVTNPATNFPAVTNQCLRLTKYDVHTNVEYKRKFDCAMSILSRIIFTIANIHWCFSANTIDCCVKRLALIAMYSIHNVTLQPSRFMFLAQ